MSETVTLVSDIAKIDEEKRQVFGIFSLIEKNGELVTDTQSDQIEPEVLSEACYSFVASGDAQAGESHERANVGTLIESVFLDPEKCQALQKALRDAGVAARIEIPATLWWGGFRIDDDATWSAIKSGKLRSFSIQGKGHRQNA